MKVSLPIIETERLLLREIQERDMFDMFEYARLSYVGPVAGWEPHSSVEYTKDVIKQYRRKYTYGQLGVFAVVLKENGKNLFMFYKF